ncbi:hypothetical protein BDP27DRAFT_1430627 [Rhodocollybia butyracea]|uniref:Uncharacterized protein n=1 Tax=Rhodocollybia butyracea TaxID=206335 RepID=A0A9P5PAY1_9AGAR|nr:hypothetical protein BDP27DRAFT_1430627 [Rhodocollybia butyracea]
MEQINYTIVRGRRKMSGTIRIFVILTEYSIIASKGGVISAMITSSGPEIMSYILESSVKSVAMVKDLFSKQLEKQHRRQGSPKLLSAGVPPPTPILTVNEVHSFSGESTARHIWSSRSEGYGPIDSADVSFDKDVSHSDASARMNIQYGVGIKDLTDSKFTLEIMITSFTPDNHFSPNSNEKYQTSTFVAPSPNYPVIYPHSSSTLMECLQLPGQIFQTQEGCRHLELFTRIEHLIPKFPCQTWKTPLTPDSPGYETEESPPD